MVKVSGNFIVLGFAAVRRSFGKPKVDELTFVLRTLRVFSKQSARTLPVCFSKSAAKVQHLYCGLKYFGNFFRKIFKRPFL